MKKFKIGQSVQATDACIKTYRSFIYDSHVCQNTTDLDAEDVHSVLMWAFADLDRPTGVVLKNAQDNRSPYWVKLSNRFGNYEHYMDAEDLLVTKPQRKKKKG